MQDTVDFLWRLMFTAMFVSVAALVLEYHSKTQQWKKAFRAITRTGYGAAFLVFLGLIWNL